MRDRTESFNEQIAQFRVVGEFNSIRGLTFWVRGAVRRVLLNPMVSRFVDWLVSGSLRRLHIGLQQLGQMLLPELRQAPRPMTAGFFAAGDQYVAAGFNALDFTLKNTQLGRIPLIVRRIDCE